MEYGKFPLTLTFPPDYPLHPPSVKFLSAMFHPNIAPDGRFPLTNWSPDHDVTKILTDIQSLLAQPQLDSAVNPEAAQVYRQDRREYERRVDQIIKCDFDLCSSCAAKEDTENVCLRGHQLYPVKLSGDSIDCWICDVCDFECCHCHEETVDEDVEVWRCEKHKRFPGADLGAPGGIQTGENIEQRENKVGQRTTAQEEADLEAGSDKDKENSPGQRRRCCYIL